jgi:hypothetical protein
VPDRLLEDEPASGIESDLADPMNDGRKGGWRRCAIKEPPTAAPELSVERHQMLAKHAEGGCIVERRGHVGQSALKRLPAAVVNSMPRELLYADARTLAELPVIELASARTDARCS